MARTARTTKATPARKSAAAKAPATTPAEPAETPAPAPVETPADPADPAPAETPAPETSSATVTVEVGDPAKAAADQRRKADAELAGRLRADRVASLKIERENLSRRPNPDARRIAEVDAEIDRYSEQPARRSRETA